MIKVMMIVPAIGTGGGEKVAITIAKYIDRKRFELLMVSLYPQQKTIYEQDIIEGNINLKYLNKHSGVDFRIIKELREAIKEFQPDIIHTHLYVVPYVLLAAPRKIIKYHTVHNIAEKEAEGLLRVFMRIAYFVGNFIPVTISPFCKQSFVELYGYKKDVSCILNGIDVKKFKPMPTKHDVFKFICVARFEPQKNHALLVKTFAEVHKIHSDTVLELVGDGYLRNEIENMVLELNLGDAVIMNGISSDIVGKNNSADVFVLASDFEGLPVSVLEAMACGLPIISTDAGGTHDIVISGENGLIVPVGDQRSLKEAMLHLYENDELRKKMGEQSRKHALLNSVDHFVEQYEQLYEVKGGSD